MLKINEISIIECGINQPKLSDQRVIYDCNIGFSKSILKIQNIEEIPVKDNLIQKNNLIKDVKNNI